jgi:hypothetical protein
MKFTFNSEQYGTTVEISFEATHIDQIRDMFDQFLRGSGFHFEDEEDVYTNKENSDTSEKCVHETDNSIHEQWDTSDMAHRPGGLSVEQAEKQEPVAWMYKNGIYISDPSNSVSPEFVITPLYTAPPQREWVGINIDEIPSLWGNADADLWLFAQDIEAKLKERNT